MDLVLVFRYSVLASIDPVLVFTVSASAFSDLVSNKNKINDFKSSDYIMKYGLLVGCHQGLSYKDISYIHKVVLNFKKIK